MHLPSSCVKRFSLNLFYSVFLEPPITTHMAAKAFAWFWKSLDYSLYSPTSKTMYSTSVWGCAAKWVEVGVQKMCIVKIIWIYIDLKLIQNKPLNESKMLWQHTLPFLSGRGMCKWERIKISPDLFKHNFYLIPSAPVAPYILYLSARYFFIGLRCHFLKLTFLFFPCGLMLISDHFCHSALNFTFPFLAQSAS